MPQTRTNRTVWIVLAVIVLIMLIGGLAVPKKKKASAAPPPPPADARALVLPNDNTVRTVIVPACGSTSPTRPGYLRFQLGNARSVLIPDCTPPGHTNATAPAAASAFVLPVGASRLIDRQVGVGVRQQVLVPANTKATTLVIPACAAGTTVKPKAKKQDVILSPASSTTATAPAC
jgi:hypothetical protein